MEKISQNRREFLKTGLTGMVGAAVALNRTGKADGAKPEVKEPIRRKLGKTGIKLPVVSMGTGDAQDPALIKAALDAGIVLLATSQYYGQGQNERMIGQAVKGRKRDSFMVMTSAMPEGIDFKAGLFTEASKAEPFLEKFEGSLERLQMEYVDIFLLPFVAKRESVFFEPLLKAMEQIKKQGKARFIGIATHSYEAEAIRAAVETKVYDVVMTAYNFRRKNILEIADAVRFAAGAGMGIVAMKTMAGAFWDKEKTKPINSKAALKWVLQDKNVHTAVPGLTTFEQLADDMTVVNDLSLSEEEKLDLQLTSADPPDGPYCQQCGECVSQCRYGLDIPTFMRGHMYAYGYGNLERARETLSLAVGDDAACSRCASCSVQCAMRSDIKRKMLDMARLEINYSAASSGVLQEN